MKRNSLISIHTKSIDMAEYAPAGVDSFKKFDVPPVSYDMTTRIFREGQY